MRHTIQVLTAGQVCLYSAPCRSGEPGGVEEVGRGHLV